MPWIYVHAIKTFFLQFGVLQSSSPFEDWTTRARNLWNPYALHPYRDPGKSARSTVQFLLRSCSIAGDNLQKQFLCVQEFIPTIADFIIWCKNLYLLLLYYYHYYSGYHGIWSSNVLRGWIEPVNSFTGARDYARSAVASWAELCSYSLVVFSPKLILI